MTRVLPLILVLGCGSLMPEPATTEVVRTVDPACMARCNTLDTYYLAWQAVGMVGSGIGTAATAVGAVIDGVVDEEDAADWTMGLLITGAVGGVAAVLGNWLAGSYADRTSECIAACRGE